MPREDCPGASCPRSIVSPEHRVPGGALRRLDTVWLATVVAVAAGLITVATFTPAVFPAVAVGVALAGYLLTTVVGLTLLGETVRRAIGVVPMLGGLTLLGGSVAFALLSGVSATPAGTGPGLAAASD